MTYGAWYSNNRRLADFLRYLVEHEGFEASELPPVVEKPHNWREEFIKSLERPNGGTGRYVTIDNTSDGMCGGVTVQDVVYGVTREVRWSVSSPTTSSSNEAFKQAVRLLKQADPNYVLTEQDKREERASRRYKMEPAPRSNPDGSLYDPWVLRDTLGNGRVVARGSTRDHLEEVYERKGISGEEIR